MKEFRMRGKLVFAAIRKEVRTFCENSLFSFAHEVANGLIWVQLIVRIAPGKQGLDVLTLFVDKVANLGQHPLGKF